MSTAKVHDFTLAAFRRTLDKRQPPEGGQTATVLEDMADGVLALDCALTLAGFSYEARSSDLYQTDRRAAVVRASEEHYDEIPAAPPRSRRRKPRRAPTVRVEQAFVSAARNVEKGRRALQDLSDDSRAALLESTQGEELRRTLLKLQADIIEVLEDFPQKKSHANR